MINENLTKYLDLHSIQYETNVSLKKRTWIHRGGIAELFITPVNAEELEKVVSFLYSQSIRFQLIGRTSNLYILICLLAGYRAIAPYVSSKKR